MYYSDNKHNKYNSSLNIKSYFIVVKWFGKTVMIIILLELFCFIIQELSLNRFNDKFIDIEFSIYYARLALQNYYNFNKHYKKLKLLRDQNLGS